MTSYRPPSSPLAILLLVLVLALAETELFLCSLDHALGLLLGPFFPDVLDRGVLADRRQVETIHRLREAQIGVHTRHNDPRVDRDEFDADQRHPDERVDDEPLVQQDVEDIGETARSAAPAHVRCGWCGHGHARHLPDPSSLWRSAHSMREISPASRSRSCRLGYFVILSNRTSAYS